MLEEMKLGELLNLMNAINGNKSECKKEDGRYCIVRTYSAGVFAGEIQSRNGREVILHNARRLWYWEGAASLSQLAMEGVAKPEKCKFPCEVDKVELLEVIEIIDCTDVAKQSIKGVKVWEQQ
jgi:hypothetical protein